jgi:hypothetical protein
MNKNFNEIFDMKKAQYIIENYDSIKGNFREESEQRLKNMSQSLKKEVSREQSKLMYHTNKIIILVVTLLAGHYHYKLYLVKLDTPFRMNIIMMLILVTVTRF